MTQRIQHNKPQESSKEYEYSAEDAEQQQVEDAKIQRAQQAQRAKEVGDVALMNEIDGVLEENAAAMVSQYVQRGGE